MSASVLLHLLVEMERPASGVGERATGNHGVNCGAVDFCTRLWLACWTLDRRA